MMADRPSTFGAEPNQLDRLLSCGLTGEQGEAGSVQKRSLNSVAERLGGRIGRYHLVDILGEGGMGIVYLAEQEEPVRRQVALKIIKPGMDSQQVLARFKIEQQALALIEHPHVARVYDAGLAASGRPYFVMEHVKGLPITKHCDEHQLTIEERLKLFLHVCEAVQHAHQKGIIHRDLKPSNILVAVEDKESLPKVIDFGVARATDQVLNKQTFQTEQGQFVGTPEFMSPEQADPGNRDIDTRTDIYSLGAILYQLLTGLLPFNREILRERGIDHIRKVICEQDPVTPSTKLSKTSTAKSTESAQKRRTDVQTLQRTLRGDLDWITLEAMEKDRAQRYATVDALATDIRNYLLHQPVSAAPPRILYRAKKFVRRRRQALAAVAGIVLMSVAGIAVTLMSIRAAQQRSYAESLEHWSALAETQMLVDSNKYEQAQAAIAPLLNSPHVGRQARLLQTQILIALGDAVKATVTLEGLLDEDDEVAGRAHFLLSNIYYEDDPWSPGKREEIQAKRQHHSREAERLISGTAEYCFLQARASYDVRRRLEYLNTALQIDNNHYDSLRERAYIHCAQGDYPKMSEDASQMIVLRSGDSTGYFLRAIARREQGRWEDAIADHNKAIARSPDDGTLYEQRSNTYVRMDRYALALADAQRAADLDPDNLHYSGIVFSLRVACGDSEQALQQYKDLLKRPGTDLQYSPFMPGTGRWNTKDLFGFVTAGYTFLLPARQSSWPLPPEQPRCAPIWAMREATAFHDQLSRHAKRIVAEGFGPSWSPDGSKIAYSAGTHWASAVAIMDPQTGAIELLTAPGKDPRWSPDGRTIAFVRDRQSIAMTAITLMGHIATMERWRRQGPLPSVEEIWVIDVASGELHRIAEGAWPSWGADSRHVYFRSGSTFCSATIDRDDPIPTIILERSSAFPIISPDGQYVAEADFRCLRVRDVHSGEEVLQWVVPPFPATGLWFNWSPDSRQLVIGGFPTCRMGLWILDIGTGDARRILNGHFLTAAWSPDRSQIAIVTGPPHIEIWLAQLDPNQPAAQALGDGRTVKEHCRELIEYYSRGVAADPNYIDSHLRRTDAALWINDSRAPEFLEELDRAFKCTPYEAAGCAARAQAILSSPADLRDRLLLLALFLARKAVEKEPENSEYRKVLETARQVQQ